MRVNAAARGGADTHAAQHNTASSFAEAAYAGKDVLLEFQVKVWSTADVACMRPDVWGPALPLCTSLQLVISGGVRIGDFERALAHMTAVAKLTLVVIGIGRRSDEGSEWQTEDEDEVDGVGAGIANIPQGPWEPRRGAPWQALFTALRPLTTLCDLHIGVNTLPALRYQQDAQAPVSAASIVESLAGPMCSLRSVTRLSVGLATRCWRSCLPRVFDACCCLPHLQAQSLFLQDDEVDEMPEMDRGGEPEEYEGQRDEANGVRAPTPCLAGVGGMTGLETLVSCNGGPVFGMDALLRRELPKMTRLRCLQPFAEVGVGRGTGARRLRPRSHAVSAAVV